MRWISPLGMTGILFLSACATQTGDRLPPGGEPITIGTELRVAQPFDYPAGRDTLWFQYGEIVRPQAITVWAWHCSLDRRLGARGQRVTRLGSGGFVVSGIREYRLIVRSGPFPLVAGPFNSDGHYQFTVEFALASSEYPEIESLRCERRLESRSQERRLSLGELRVQLGRYLVVRPADAGNL